MSKGQRKTLESLTGFEPLTSLFTPSPLGARTAEAFQIERGRETLDTEYKQNVMVFIQL